MASTPPAPLLRAPRPPTPSSASCRSRRVRGARAVREFRCRLWHGRRRRGPHRFPPHLPFFFSSLSCSSLRRGAVRQVQPHAVARPARAHPRGAPTPGVLRELLSLPLPRLRLPVPTCNPLSRHANTTTTTPARWTASRMRTASKRRRFPCPTRHALLLLLLWLPAGLTGAKTGAALAGRRGPPVAPIKKLQNQPADPICSTDASPRCCRRPSQRTMCR